MFVTIVRSLLDSLSTLIWWNPYVASITQNTWASGGMGLKSWAVCQSSFLITVFNPLKSPTKRTSTPLALIYVCKTVCFNFFQWLINLIKTLNNKVPQFLSLEFSQVIFINRHVQQTWITHHIFSFQLSFYKQNLVSLISVVKLQVIFFQLVKCHFRSHGVFVISINFSFFC